MLYLFDLDGPQREKSGSYGEFPQVLFGHL